MRVRFVTFDCADTLLQTNWEPAQFAWECSEELGLGLHQKLAVATYHRLLVDRRQEFLRVNQSRSQEASEAFWRSITEEWLDAMKASASPDDLHAVAERRLFGPESTVFRLFDDVRPALDALREEGFRLAVISNWDSSLHKVLRSFGLAEHFDFVLASLEEGVEKPDPEIFRIALRRLEALPGEVAHVGDSPVDDLMGARNVGIRGLLIDRSRDRAHPPILARLTEIPEVLSSSD
jgi:putative hydrolase of the HAD superfamily